MQGWGLCRRAARCGLRTTFCSVQCLCTASSRQCSPSSVVTPPESVGLGAHCHSQQNPKPCCCRRAELPGTEHPWGCFSLPPSRIPKCFPTSGFPVLLYLDKRFSLFSLSFSHKAAELHCCQGCCPTAEPCPRVLYGVLQQRRLLSAQPAALPDVGTHIPAPAACKLHLTQQRDAFWHPQSCQQLFSSSG